MVKIGKLNHIFLSESMSDDATVDETEGASYR
jgi:hypothetical protein